VQHVGAAGREHDCIVQLRKRMRGGAADAARCAGDDHYALMFFGKYANPPISLLDDVTL
jgi:hypothetical protein